MSSIISTGYFLPSTVVSTTSMLAETRPERFDIAEDFIEKNVGIKTVRHTDQLPSELAAQAAEQALAQAEINPDQIGAVIFTGIEGDYMEPATAHIVQHRLALKAPICFDVSNACLGFMSGMAIAKDMIANGTCRYALVCTGERPSQISKSVIRTLKSIENPDLFKNKMGALTTGDAGGAIILGPAQKDSWIRGFYTGSASGYSNLCYYRWEKNNVDGQMVMGKIATNGFKLHKSIHQKSLSLLGWGPEKIDFFITHQVGQRPFMLLSRLFLVGVSKMSRTFDTLGNLASATFPVNLGLALESGRIKSGSHVYAAMSGSGISVCHAGMRI